MEMVLNGPDDGPLFVFSHGAGAPLTSAFMEKVALGLAAKGIRVARFNFNYMQQRVETGSRRPPERAPKLLAQFDELVQQLNQPMIIGGKSMGGRMSSLLAASADFKQANKLIKGVACLGYPFHPQGKAEKLRIEHLPNINVPLLIIQGDRDKLGSREETDSYGLPESIEWCWLEDGDHDLKPRVKSGFTHQQHIDTAILSLNEFIVCNL
jgi:uncharacterized protein